MSSVKLSQKTYLGTQLQSVCTKFFENLQRTDEEQNHIYYTVLYYIHSAPHLSELYLNWTELPWHEKCIFNNQMKYSLLKACRVIYPPVIRAFEYWDMVQDTYGAPGFSGSPLKGHLNEETDSHMMKMMLIMEKTINQIHLKRKLLAEMLSHKEPRNILYSYKWRIICKTISKKRSYLTRTNEEVALNEDRSDEHSTDLNGCGDTTWFSDVE